MSWNTLEASAFAEYLQKGRAAAKSSFYREVDCLSVTISIFFKKKKNVTLPIVEEKKAK